LYSFLELISRPPKEFEELQWRWWWVDAICINQDDLQEREAQVKVMGRICKQAERVAVWWGNEEEDSSVAMRFLKFLRAQRRDLNYSDDPAPYRPLIASQYDAQWQALRKLLVRPWWTRVWTWQELLIPSQDQIPDSHDESRRMYFYCGREKIWAKHLTTAIYTIYICGGGKVVGGQAFASCWSRRRIIQWFTPIKGPENAEKLSHRSLVALIAYVGDCDATKESDRIYSQIFFENTEYGCPYAALFGLGGIGKTQIAVEFAYRVQKRSPEHSIFWVQANDATSFEASYRKIAEQLQIPLDTDNLDIKARVNERLSREDAGKWLIVVDSADDPILDNDKGNTTPLVQLLPSSSSGGILFTTRNLSAATDYYAKSNVITVDQMNEREATALLKKGLRDERRLALRLAHRSISAVRHITSFESGGDSRAWDLLVRKVTFWSSERMASNSQMPFHSILCELLILPFLWLLNTKWVRPLRPFDPFSFFLNLRPLLVLSSSTRHFLTDKSIFLFVTLPLPCPPDAFPKLLPLRPLPCIRRYSRHWL